MHQAVVGVVPFVPVLAFLGASFGSCTGSRLAYRVRHSVQRTAIGRTLLSAHRTASVHTATTRAAGVQGGDWAWLQSFPGQVTDPSGPVRCYRKGLLHPG